MEEHEHTTRLTEAGFVICVCGWATAAAEKEPREAAAAHIAETGPADIVPLWVERPGGRVCVPGNGERHELAGASSDRDRIPPEQPASGVTDRRSD